MQKAIEKLLEKTPGLKAKEIAKQLGTDRKSINAFLYRHKNIFIQDDTFCWFLAIPPVQVLELDANWVTADSFENSLTQTGCLLSSKSLSILVKIPKDCKIMLIASARLLAILNQLVFNGKDVSVDFIDCASIKHFLSRSGFFDHLDDRVTVIPNRPASAAKIYKGNNNAIVEFGAIDPNQENTELIRLLWQAFVEHSDSRYDVAAFTVFSELIGNVMEHSDSEIKGFAALQKYGDNKKYRKHIQTVVSDSGRGIATTLRPSLKEHYPDLYRLYKEENVESDAGLVITALSKGEISRFGSGRGLGFKSSRTQAMKFDAKLFVRQERFSLNFNYKNGVLVDVERKLGIPKILGSHLCFDFFVDPS